MTELTFSGRLIELVQSSGGAKISPELAHRLYTYFELLRRWNRRMNLTGFDLDQPTDASLHRLFVEPLVVASALHGNAGALMDLGSGGGSPAIPMLMALGSTSAVLVESRARKCTFLREVARNLALDHVRVMQARVEALAGHPELVRRFAFVTVRAVDVTPVLLEIVANLLSPGGRLVWFRADTASRIPRGWRLHANVLLAGGTTTSVATVLRVER